MDKQLQQKLARMLEIPSDVAFDLPKIAVIGNIQLYLENHRGIIEYSPELIRVAVSIGELAVCGEGLSIRNITKDEVHLDGMIKNIQFIR